MSERDTFAATLVDIIKYAQRNGAPVVVEGIDPETAFKRLSGYAKARFDTGRNYDYDLNTFCSWIDCNDQTGVVMQAAYYWFSMKFGGPRSIRELAKRCSWVQQDLVS